MSSLNNEAIQGNLSVSRDHVVGGHLKARGNSQFDHNVVIKGWLDAKNIKGPCKGLYASEEALKKAYPKPMPGWYALVGDTLPADVYRVDGGEWVATGEKGGEVNLYLDQLEQDVADLDDEVKDIQELIGNGLLVAGSVQFNATATAVTLTYKLRKSDGTETPYNVTVPIVTAEKAGMMSAADKQALNNAGTNITKLNEALNNEIKARTEADKQHTNDITKLKEDLSAETKARTDADKKHSEDITELEQAVWPLTVSLNATPTIAEAGVSAKIELAWNVTRRGGDVADESEMTLNGEEVFSTAKDVTINESTPKTLTYTLKATYEGMTESASKQVSVVYPSYFGSVGADWTPTETTVRALSKSLQTSRASTHTGISTSNGKIAYCYPASFGKLTSVKDGNGYEVIDSYTLWTVNVGGVSYNCYLLTTPVTSSGVTQIYK